MFIWNNEVDTVKELTEIGYQLNEIPTDIKPGVPFHMVVDNDNSTKENIIHKLKYLTEENVLKFARSFKEKPYTSLTNYIYHNPTDVNLREFNKYYQLFNTFGCSNFLRHDNEVDFEHIVFFKNDKEKKLKDINPSLYEEINSKLHIMTEMIKCGLVRTDTVIHFDNLTFTLGEYNQAAFSYSYVGVAGYRFIGNNRIEIDYNGDIKLAYNHEHADYILSRKINDMVYYCEHIKPDESFNEKYNITNFLNGNLDSEELSEEQVLDIIRSGNKINHLYSVDDKIKIVDFLEQNVIYSVPFIRMLLMNKCLIKTTEAPKYNAFCEYAQKYAFFYKEYTSHQNSEERKLRDLNF